MRKLLLTLSFVIAVAAGARGAVAVRTASLSVDGKQLLLESRIEGEWRKAPLTMALFDGKTKTFIPLPAPEIREENGKITLSYRMSDLSWQILFRPRQSDPRRIRFLQFGQRGEIS